MYNTAWNYAEKKGYSGTEVFFQKKPVQIRTIFDAGMVYRLSFNFIPVTYITKTGQTAPKVNAHNISSTGKPNN